MAEILPIRLYGDPILKKKALSVQDFSGIPQLAQNMFETMFEARGVGLAAPQVGIPKRMFVVAEYQETEDEEGKEADLKSQVRQLYVFVNPVITFRSGNQVGTEGCLSLPGLYNDEVPRELQIKVEYQDKRGEKKELEAEGYLARVIQHELDHLDGTLFFQRLPLPLKQQFLDEHREDLADFQRQAKAYLKMLNVER